ncbi:isoleucine--tRNA ligase [Candidatus Woesearchaeota archaeon]|nr:MAG: isoleucine--tRNA ligase [Candidatus Woesearchaeota archaeon]
MGSGYDFAASEEAMLAFWEKQGIYAKAKAQCAKGEDFYFLDGPPYTSGKVHLGTAWNKALKDMVLRYKRMRGYNVWDRAGYDMHGLPTEHATQKKLGLTTKEDIESFGVGKFIEECKQLCTENMQAMNKDFIRLGVWMDFPNAYQSISDEFIEGEWWLVKRAHEEGRLYEGLKTMTWCPQCASALAKHECEYRTVSEPSIFVKFAVQGKQDEYLIIWTTTPWTIPFNLAVMVNPELEYVRAEVKTKGKTETWVLAKALVGPVVQAVADGSFTIKEVFPGTALEGTRYLHPFERHIGAYEVMRAEAPKLHTVILSEEYVDTSAGSGLVHCAPGCGPEDFEVGRRNGLPPYNTLDETGRFPEGMGKFSGKVAKVEDAFFIAALEEEGALIATVEVEHEYPHCWRHHTPVIFRATKQWFFKVEDIKEQLIEQNNGINWVPQAAYNAFDSWLKSLRDNSVTKQRYWGTAIPVWRCDTCDHYVVVGSKRELKLFAGELPKDLHKPWIDEVTWPCTNCKATSKTERGTMRRIPDILDVWVDAGTVSWNCLNYPQKEEDFARLFPADFILEGKDQIRGWFNLLHVCSNIAFGKRCFDACYMHGFINDAQGRKMSKSLGNYILPEEVVAKYGANTFRYYAIGAANPGLDMNYNFEDVELKHRNLLVYWNLRQFLLGLHKQGVALKEPKALGIEERYILSRLHSTVTAVTECMEAYRLNEVPTLIEQLLLDLSRQYIQLVREKASQGTDEEKEQVLYAALTTYKEAMRMFSIVAPLFTEHVYQELREPFSFAEESIHLTGWPEADEAQRDEALERDMRAVFDVISAGLAARDAAQLGVRWPSAELVVDTDDAATRTAITNLVELIKRQVNVKEVTVRAFTEARVKVKPDFKALGREFGKETARVVEAIQAARELGTMNEPVQLGAYTIKPEHVIVEREAPADWAIGNFSKGVVYLRTNLTPELEAEGFARELIRRGQQLRKQAGLEKRDRVQLCITGEGLAPVLSLHGEEIAKRCGAVMVPRLEKGEELSAKIRGKQVTLRLVKA